MAEVGASLPVRDAVDARILEDVRAGGGKIIDSPDEVGGWPEHRQAAAPADTDLDGMPDAWEETYGFDPSDASDNSLDKDADGYTNIEEFLNSTDPSTYTDPYASAPSPVLVETPVGRSVPVQLTDPNTGTAPVALTFSNVSRMGTTSLATTSAGPTPPSGFQLGDPPVFYEITTTAAFEGSVDLSFNYSGISVGDEADLKLFHFGQDGWEDVTTSVDTENDVIHGSVAALSTFAIFEGAASSAPTPDFNGDGVVNFSDFVDFAQRFGASEGQANFDTRFDLDEDKKVGFGDFVVFAQNFGKTMGGKPIVLTRPADRLKLGVNGEAGLSLAPEAGNAPDRVDLAVRLTDAARVEGFKLRVRYDDSALELLEATAAEGVSVLSDDLAQRDVEREAGDALPVALQVSTQPGEILLADALRPEAAVEGEGVLVRLSFRLLDKTVPGRVSIDEVQVSDGLGRINELVGARLDELRAIPTEYALSHNYPNPFNPETQIPYQLPEVGDMSLVVYNTLGQVVRVLVEEVQEPGYYRVVWDGRDARGRRVASGVYLVRMATGTFSDVKKVLLLK